MQSGMLSKFEANYFECFSLALDRIIQYKDRLNIPDFNSVMSIRIFNVLGKSITQLRYAKGLSFKDKKEYLVNLKKQRLIQDYYGYYYSISNQLERPYYKMLINCLNKGKYLIIILALYIKNLMDWDKKH